jgi:dTDP-glucose 4,6-dehydratase
LNKILVTGGAGFIGSHLVHHLVEERDCHVLVVDKLTYAANLDALQMKCNSQNLTFQKLDICDANALGCLIAEFAPNAIMHLAAESHVDRSIYGPAEFVQTNLVGTYTLLQAALDFYRSLDETRRNGFRYLQVSTDEVFGSLGIEDSDFSEQSPYAPNSPYSATKAGADHLARAWMQTYGLPVITTYSSNNFGPFQHWEKLIPTVISNAINLKPIPLFGDGTNIRDWIYVGDHVTALFAVLQRGEIGDTYCIGANNELSNLEIASTICEMLDKLCPMDTQLQSSAKSPESYKRLIQLAPDRPGHDFRYALNTTKLSSQIGWYPQHDFESSLYKTVQWYVEAIQGQTDR